MAAYCLIDYHDHTQKVEPVGYLQQPVGYRTRTLADGRGYMYSESHAATWTVSHYATLDILVDYCCAAIEHEIRKRELYSTLNSLSHGCRTPLTTMIDDAQAAGNIHTQQQCLAVTSTVVDFIEFHRQTIDPYVTQKAVPMREITDAWKNEYCTVTSDVIDVDHNYIMIALDAYKQAVWHVCCTAYNARYSECRVELYVQDAGEELEICATFDVDVPLQITTAYEPYAKRVAAPLSSYLACRLIEQAGGSMRIVENPRAVAFVIPYSVAARIKRPDNLRTNGQALNSNSPLKILLAEDNQINQRAIKRMLDAYGTVDCADDGRQALQMIERTAYDVIMLDIKMPGVDGYQVACFARQYNATAKIIACTAQLVSHSDHNLFDYVIQKPIKKEELRSAMLTVHHNIL